MAGRCQLRTAKNRTRDGGSHQCPSGLCCMTMQLHILIRKFKLIRTEEQTLLLRKCRKCEIYNFKK